MSKSESVRHVPDENAIIITGTFGEELRIGWNFNLNRIEISMDKSWSERSKTTKISIILDNNALIQIIQHLKKLKWDLFWNHVLSF